MKSTIIIRVVAVALLIGLILNANKINAKSNAPCDVDRGPCSQKTEDGVTLEIDILPKPVKAMSELVFNITVRKNGALLDNADVSLDLSMPGMYMGRNHPLLKRIAAGQYEGKGVITRCASGGKTWQAKVTVLDKGMSTSSDFVFEVH